MKYIYTRFLLLLLTFLMTLPSQAQNVLVYTEDFENGPGAFSLNNSLYGANSGSNRWIINNAYDGLNLAPNTLEQNNTSGGSINFAPKSNYLHIFNLQLQGQNVQNANFSPTSAAERFVSTRGFCTRGLDSVRIAFFIHMAANPGAQVQLLYSAEGGDWTPVPNGVFTVFPLWNYVEFYNEAFDHISNLRFGFLWKNEAGTGEPATSVGIDGVRIVGKFDPVKYNVRLEIDTVMPISVCRGKEVTVRVNNPVPLCGDGFYEVQMSNEFGSFANPPVRLTYSASNLSESISFFPIGIPPSLNAGDCYRFRVIRVDANPFIFSDTSACIKVTDCPNNIYTKQPAVTKNLLDTVCVGSVIDVPFNSDGVYLNNTYIAQLSDSNGNFPPNPNVLGFSNDDASYPLGSPPGSVSGLIREQPHPIPPGCNYFIRVISNSPSVTGSVYGPICIRRCDIETNDKRDLQFCVDNTNGADTTIRVKIKVDPPPASYTPPNEFQIQVLDFTTFQIINTGVLGKVSAINDTLCEVSIPPLPLLGTVGLIPGTYYLRIISTQSSQPWDQLGTLIRLTIGAPNPLGVTIELVDQLTYQAVEFSGDTTVCFLGGMLFRIKLSEFNPYSTYVWGLNSDADFYTGGPYNGILFNSLGDYVIYCTETNYGCVGPGSNKINVSVKGPPNPSIIGPFQVCEGDTVQYKAPLTEDTYYFWTTSPGMVIDTLNNQAQITFPQADSSVISINVVNECYGRSGTRTISVRKPPQISLGADTTICAGSTVNLSIPPGTSQKVYWSMNDGEVFSQQPDIAVSPDSSTLYNVKVTNYGNLACEAYDTIAIEVEHKKYLSAKYIEICPGTEVNLQTDTSATAYYWSTGASGKSITVKDTGWYIVEIDIDSAICALVDSFKVNTKACYQPLILPNAFSPNDDKVNDVFTAEQTFTYEAFEIIIYNRWGLRVYESVNPYFEWNGFDLSGDKLPDGTYFYVAKLKHFEQSDKQKGTVTLLR
ncbi:MAG: gliding motility-associated C-terminal domain-containing protein [Bacteroidia bacterium]|nr:gliding motility-associated C-terminal domain-containing protein [Bacteroidia bacterium]MCC6768776.1 gliding motility-associated C-terminal domain-containing protein [Bacteroidia bacterium]